MAVAITLSLLFAVFLAIVLVAYALEFNKRKNKLHKEKELMNAAFQEALLKSRLEIQEETFKKVSLELHDNIGQMLSLVKLNLNTLEPGVGGEYNGKLQDAKDMLTNVIQEIRDISRTMNSDVINRGGIARAIEVELQTVKKLLSVDVDFQWTEQEIDIDPQVELILFRIVQETLHNVIKHSRASRLKIKSIYQNDQLQLEIADNGVGFNSGEVVANGSGLINIESRCKLINADLQINSAPGNGTNITINLPILAS